MNEKIVMAANQYDRIDGRNAYRSDIKRLTLGEPRLEENKNMQIAAQIWKENADGQLENANAIKGVAGMRSYLFWVNAVANGANLRTSMYHKVIYKISTDSDEIAILEQALSAKGFIEEMEQMETISKDPKNSEVMVLHLSENGHYDSGEEEPDDPDAVRLRKSEDSEGHSDQASENALKTQSSDNGDNGSTIYHELEQEPLTEQEKLEFRKKLNQEARESVKGSVHSQVKLIVHRPEVTEESRMEYTKQTSVLKPVIQELVRKTTPLLEHETANDFIGARLYGTKFCGDRIAMQDFRYFAKKSLPQDNPVLAVALRIDESASMATFGRLEAARQAAIALYEFCCASGIPVMIFGELLTVPA